jgi:hypothetical protein
MIITAQVEGSGTELVGVGTQPKQLPCMQRTGAAQSTFAPVRPSRGWGQVRDSAVSLA